MTLFVLIAVFALGFIFRFNGKSPWVAWLLSCFVMPIFVLGSEFLLPYMGGGASMWPIALVFGSFYGVIAGGLGALAASFLLRRKQTALNQSHENDA